MCLSKPIGLLALLDEESRFPQSTEFTLVNKWRENLISSHFTATTSSYSLSRKSIKSQKQLLLNVQPLFTIHHYAGHIEYTAKDFLEKNRDYVPIEIIDLLLQSDDYLVNLLFRSRLHKTGSVMYTEHDEQDKASILFSSQSQQTTTMNRIQGTLSTYFRYSLKELVSIVTSTQPTFIRCLVPNRLPFQTSHITYDHTSYFPHNFTFDSSQFDEKVVLEQIRYSGLIETIKIRRHGYSHRILFDDFISMYSCLIDSNLKSNTDNNQIQLCELILKAFHLKNYMIGKTKVFLKFSHIEQLNIAYKNFLTKIIRLQSWIRMYIIRKQNQSITIKTKSEQAIIRLQAVVRGFLSRRKKRQALIDIIKIQSYWRIWYERKYFNHLLHYHNQQTDVSYFLKQIEFYGNNLYQRLKELHTHSNPSSINNHSINQSVSKIIEQSKSENLSRINSKTEFIELCKYYDEVFKQHVSKNNINLIEKSKKKIITNAITLRRPSTAPPSTNIPQAPPCPPPSFFQSNKTISNAFQRQKAAPVTVTTPIDELKQIFATRK